MSNRLQPLLSPSAELSLAVREERNYSPVVKVCLLNFLEEHYFPREPLLSKYLALRGERVTPAARDLILTDLRRRFDVVARKRCLYVAGVDSERGRRVGVALATLQRRYLEELDAPWYQVPIMSELLSFWYDRVQLVAERRVNFFELYPEIDTVMRLMLVCVDEAYEGRRVGSSVLREIVGMARRRCFDLVYAVVTCRRMRRILEKLEFTSHAEMDLNEFRDGNGDPVYGETSEPGAVSIMALKLKVTEK